MNSRITWVAFAFVLPVIAIGAEEDSFSTGQIPYETSSYIISEPTQDVRSEFRHKITTEVGRGPEQDILGNEDKSFFSVRYEPSFIGYWPHQRWSNWQLYARAWLSYEDGRYGGLTGDNFNYDDRTEMPRYWYAEMRELYIRKNFLAGHQSLSATIGRQRFFDHNGIWWDDSLESIRFDYQGATSHGFMAVAKKFWNYNTDVNRLDPRDRGIFYAFGEYVWNWTDTQAFGVRAMYERDGSGANSEDSIDFTGYRYGLFIRGAQQLGSPFPFDYNIEAIGLNGDLKDNESIESTREYSVSGWALLSEIGYRFYEQKWTPRLFLIAGLTDASGDSHDGFRLNRIQSDRTTFDGSYSTRLVSSFLRLDLRNLAYYGIGVELNPSSRSRLDIRISDLRIRNTDGDLPIRVSSDLRTQRNQRISEGLNSSSHSLGQVFDVGYFWRMFPRAYNGRHLNINALISVSYFVSGNALEMADDKQFNLGLVIRY